MSSVGAPTAASSNQSNALVLKEGQMVHGQIKQLFPGQTAEVQIGNQKMIAKLEVPMKAGDSYYFQVSGVKPELQLKIISGPTGASESQNNQMNRLMEAMQLPKTAEMKELLTFVMNHKIPMTREGLLQAETLLQNVPASMRGEALLALQKMAELKLPFTEASMRAIIGVQSKEGLHDITAALRNLLMNDATVTPSTKDAILSTLNNVAKPLTQATGNAVLAQVVATLLDSAQSAETRFATVQLLKSAGILPPQTSLANLPQILASLMTAQGSQQQEGTPSLVVSQGQLSATATPVQQLEALKAIIQAQTGLSTSQKEALLSNVNRLIASPPSGENATRIVQEITQNLIKMTAENTLADPFRGTSDGLKSQLMTLLGQGGQSAANATTVEGNLATLLQRAESSEHQAIQRAVQLAEASVATAIDGKAVKEAIQTIFRSLGVNYESMLLGRNADVGRIAESLKPQLLALIQDPNVSAAVRESAEQFVGRMNGPLLTSGENGVQHQLVMQVPLEFFGKRIDATLEWNGRMKEDGKIDADFARILFYLDLHSLDKTVLDMQVQNRVVTVTVFNANPKLQAIGEPIQGRLKTGLESIGYKLSGVFFKDFQAETPKGKPQIKENFVDSQGVDFRI